MIASILTNVLSVVCVGVACSNIFQMIRYWRALKLIKIWQVQMVMGGSFDEARRVYRECRNKQTGELTLNLADNNFLALLDEERKKKR